MARESKTFEVTDSNSRDFGKKFKITEMPWYRVERIAVKMFHGIAKSGIELPDFNLDGDAEDLATFTLTAIFKVDTDILNEIMDEMLKSIEVVIPKDGNTRKLQENDIEDVGTVLSLRKEIIMMNIGFFTRGGIQSIG